MKRRTFSVWIIVLCMMLCGCQQLPAEQETVDIPNIPEDYIYLASENVYFQYSKYLPGILYIPLISKCPVSKADLSIDLLNDEIEIEQFDLVTGQWGLSAEAEMPFYVYQTYRGKNWDQFAQVQITYQEALKAFDSITRNDDNYDMYSSALETATNALESSQNEFYDDYAFLQRERMIPVLYRYLLVLFLKPVDAKHEINIPEIYLSLKGKEYRFPFGEFRYTPLEQDIAAGNQVLITESGLAGWHIVYANADGVFRENNGNETCLMRADRDCEITGIQLSNDQRELSDIQVVIMNDSENIAEEGALDEEHVFDIVSDYKWDGSTPITLYEGQRIYFNFSVHDSRLSNTPCGYTQYSLRIDYQYEGKTGVKIQWFPTIIQTVSGDPHEVFLWKELGIDVMAYYRDFYDRLQKMGYGIIQISKQ